jgi:hypothetical protein
MEDRGINIELMLYGILLARKIWTNGELIIPSTPYQEEVKMK